MVRIAEAYIGPLVPTDFRDDPLFPALLGRAQPNLSLLRSFLSRRYVGAVIVDPANTPVWQGSNARSTARLIRRVGSQASVARGRAPLPDSVLEAARLRSPGRTRANALIEARSYAPRYEEPR